MNLVKELEAMKLTLKIDEMSDECMRINKTIGNLPIVLFPELRKRVIDLMEEEYKLEIQLYEIYRELADEHRMEYILKAQAYTEAAIRLAKTGDMIYVN
jgi:hypothetical protein